MEYKKLLPYLYQRVYLSNYFVSKVYTFEMLEKEIEEVPKNKRFQVIKYCHDNKVEVERVTSILKAISKLEHLGKGYSNKKYDRYYKKVLEYKKDLTNIVKNYKKHCTNPKVLNPIIEAINKENEMLIPMRKPSELIYKTIISNTNIQNSKTEFLKIFYKKKFTKNKKIDYLTKLESQLLKESIGFNS